MSDESSTTTKLLKDYLDCVSAERDAKNDLLNAQSRLDKAKKELGKHLVPKEYQVGEKFSIWVSTNQGDKLLSITPKEDTFIIEWRK